MILLIITRKDSFVFPESREGEKIRNFEHNFGESPRKTFNRIYFQRVENLLGVILEND